VSPRPPNGRSTDVLDEVRDALLVWATAGRDQAALGAIDVVDDDRGRAAAPRAAVRWPATFDGGDDDARRRTRHQRSEAGAREAILVEVDRVLPGEDRVEASLRPTRLTEFVGQARVRRQLELVLAGARQRGHPADHVLLSGAPGLGKTTLAAIVAAEVGAQFRATSGPAIERPATSRRSSPGLEPGDVLFVDEVHRLPRTVEEVLYPAMEDFQLDIVVGKGPGARSIRLDLPAFTLVGATTRTGLIAAPLRDRFGFSAHLEHYETAELDDRAPVRGLLASTVDDAGAARDRRRSRGTPRIANRLLRRVRDYAEVEGDGTVDLDVARAALEVFDVDELGLDRLDRRVLEALVDRFGGGPVGTGDPGDLGGGGVGHDRGRRRAVPAAARAAAAHPARPGRDAVRLRAPRPPRPRRSGRPARPLGRQRPVGAPS
jgi:holliday junction DNA helicase RuvB